MNLVFTITVPELRIYKVWDKPLGPHPTAMFEVNLFNPGMCSRPTFWRNQAEHWQIQAQFGAFIGWLVINRGPLSALVHPNTGDDYRDHIERAFWLGTKWPVNTRLFIEMNKKREQKGESKPQWWAILYLELVSTKRYSLHIRTSTCGIPSWNHRPYPNP